MGLGRAQTIKPALKPLFLGTHFRLEEFRNLLADLPQFIDLTSQQKLALLITGATPMKAPSHARNKRDQNEIKATCGFPTGTCMPNMASSVPVQAMGRPSTIPGRIRQQPQPSDYRFKRCHNIGESEERLSSMRRTPSSGFSKSPNFSRALFNMARRRFSSSMRLRRSSARF